MSESTSAQNFGTHRMAPTGAVSAREVWQIPSGLAAVYDSLAAGSAGEYTDKFRSAGQYYLAKTSGFVALPGLDAWWDYSANAVNYKKVNDRDFKVGCFAQDELSSATNCLIDLNRESRPDIDLLNDAFLTTLVGTSAVSGFGYPVRLGGSHILELTATNEAQKVDALSVDGFSPAANAIIEIVFRVISDGAGTVVDASLGIGSATHASDADSIAEHLFVHLDANNTNINIQSKDGSTTVASTDSAIDYTEGSAVANRKYVWIDTRDPADCQVYVDGALVLPSSAFNLGAAVGPLFLLAHLEKTASTDTYKLALDKFCARFSEQ